MAGGTMGQVHHGSATTTAAIRRAIQHSQESLRALAKRHGVNQKTVAKWRKRTSDADLPTGPREPRSTVPSIEEEAVVVAFRRHTPLPLDDRLHALQPTIPHLTRSSPHRCLQRHGISRLPDTGGSEPQRSRFERYPIGFFHLDIAEVRTEQGKLHLFVAVDRTSKFAFAEPHEKATRRVAGDFLRRLVAAVPYRINTVLTDNQRHPLHRPDRRRLDARGHQGDAGGGGAPPLPPLRGGLRRSRHRAPADQATPSLDQRSGRAHEPHHQGRDGPTVPLRQPRPAQAAPRRLRRGLQLRPAPEDAEGPHTLRVHLPVLDERTRKVHPQPAPPNDGTEHLGGARSAGYAPSRPRRSTPSFTGQAEGREALAAAAARARQA